MMIKLIAMAAMLCLLFNLPSEALAKGKERVVRPPNSESQTDRRTETRVYIRRQCILGESVDRSQQEFIGALAGIFLPLLINKAIGGVSSALRKAGSAEELRDSGRLPTYLYRLSNTIKETNGERTNERKLALNPDLGCVLIIRGTFKTPDVGDQSMVSFPNTGILLAADEEDKRIARLNASNIPVEKIALEYEAAIRISNDRSALHYEGRFLEANSFQGSRSSDTRAMVISVAINGAGAKDGEPTLSLSLLNLGEVKKNGIMGPQQLRSFRSGWLGGLGLSEEALKAIEGVAVEDDQYVDVMPVTVEGTLVETDKGSKALRFIADVLDAAKEDVSKTVSEEILKDRKKAAAEAADAREKLHQDEEAAYAAYLAAKVELAKLENPTAEEKAAKEFEVERTKRAWCLKFKTLKTVGEGASGPRPEQECP